MHISRYAEPYSLRRRLRLARQEERLSTNRCLTMVAPKGRSTTGLVMQTALAKELNEVSHPKRKRKHGQAFHFVPAILCALRPLFLIV